ncbi:MAG: hypothetical protein RJB17_3 [Pseudomonadota bacterium]
MQALAQWWRRLTSRSVGQAWGLAPQGMAWALVGLARQNHELARVHTTLSLQAPAHSGLVDLAWLSHALRQNGRLRGGFMHRLNMALPAAHLQEGIIHFPAQLPKEDWPYEVQLEVSQALQLAPDEVSFDFAPEPLTQGPVQRVHWIGCAQAHMLEFKNCTRAAGWRLAAVESEAQAAWRGVRALQGGVSSLLTQAPQDWQFRLKSQSNAIPASALMDSDAAMEEAVGQVMSTPTGARLVASGLALKAWQ